MAKGFHTRLTGTILPVSFLCLLMLGVILGFAAYQYQKGNLQGRMTEVSNVRADAVGARIQQETDRLQALAATGAAKNMTGDEIIGLLKSMVSDAKNPLLVNAIYAKPDGVFISTHDERGSLRNQPYFQRLIAEDLDSIISDPLTPEGEGSRTVILLVSMRDAYGRVTGVLGSALDLSRVSGILTGRNPQAGGYSWILNGNGAVVAYPDTGQLSSAGFRVSGALVFPKADQLGEAFRKNASGVLSYTESSSGVAMSGGYVTIPETEGWKLCTAVPAKTILLPLQLGAVLYVAGVVAFLAVLLAVCTTMGRRFAAPVDDVSEALEKMKDEMAESVKVSYETTEIERLGRAFNFSSDTLLYRIRQMGEDMERQRKELETLSRKLRERHAREGRGSGELYKAELRDPVTHLINRRELLRQLDQLKSEVDMEISDGFTLLYLAIDNLESFIQGYGEGAANVVLRETAGILMHSIRTTDIAGRYENDSFIVILTGTNQVRADAVVRKLSTAFESRRGFEDLIMKGSIPGLGEIPSECRVGLSIGQAPYAAKMDMNPGTLIRQAYADMQEIRKEKGLQAMGIPLQWEESASEDWASENEEMHGHEPLM